MQYFSTSVNFGTSMNLSINFWWFLSACEEAWSNCKVSVCLYVKKDLLNFALNIALLCMSTSIPIAEETEAQVFPGCVLTKAMKLFFKLLGLMNISVFYPDYFIQFPLPVESGGAKQPGKTLRRKEVVYVIVMS